MYPLIEITTVPIEIELRTTNAKLEYARGSVEMEVSRDKGGLSIKSRAARLNIDTFEARNSVLPTTARTIKKNAEAGNKAAYEATATYAHQGQLLLKAKIGEELVTQFAKDAIEKDIKPNVGIRFLPEVGPEFSLDHGEMNIRYEMDKLNFDWRAQRPSFEFIPGDIELLVTQQPDLLIKYIGGPLYVPPSSDPNYSPIDIEV